MIFNALLLVFMLGLGAYIFKPYLLPILFSLILSVVIRIPGDEHKVRIILWLSRRVSANPSALRMMAENQRNLGLKTEGARALSNRLSSALEAEATRMETEPK